MARTSSVLVGALQKSEKLSELDLVDLKITLCLG